MSTSDLSVTPWWEEPEGDAALVATLMGLIQELRAADSGRRVRYREWDNLYDGFELSDPAGGGPGLADLASTMGDTTFNYAARALDQVHAKVTADMPTVRASGRGADYTQHLRAQALSRFIVAAAADLDLETVLPYVVHCALRVGTGAVMVSVTAAGDPCIEAFHPRELLVDPDDASHGDPRCLYRVKTVDKRTLLRMYPEREAEIAAAGCADDREGAALGRPGDWTRGASTGRVSNCADLVTAWFLPDDSGPGRRVLCLDNGTPLEDGPWTSDRFPVAMLCAWMPTVGSGLYGHGLMERLYIPQVSVNETLRHVVNQMRNSNTWWFLPDGLDIGEGALSDGDPEGINIVRGTGQGAPVFANPPVLGPEVLPVIGQFKADIYAMAGTSEAGVGSQTPLGPNASGVAMRTYHDFDTQGHVDLMKRIGVLVIDVIDRLLDAMRAEYGSNGGHADDVADDTQRAKKTQHNWEVRHPTLDPVKWSEVDMDRDAYVLELQDVSGVPDTQAGALQQMEEDAAAGRIAPEYMTRVREDPDAWWMDRCNAKADVEFVDWMVQELMDPSHEMPALPDEVVPQMLADRLRRETLTSVRLRHPPGVIDRLRQMAGELADKTNPPPAPQAPQLPTSPTPGGPGPGASGPGGPGPSPLPTGAPPPPPVNP